VAETVAPGQSKTIPVSFSTPRKLGPIGPDIVVRVSQELEPFVLLQPARFAVIARGATVNVNLIISVPSDAAVGVVEGDIRLFREVKIGQKTFYFPVLFAEMLPVVVTISRIPLPPDPGEAGKATLEGIDSDNDGVRDDIQRYIALTYPDSEKTRAVLIQFAKPAQQMLIDAEDKVLTIRHSVAKTHAISCAYYIRPLDAGDIILKLKSQLLNTEARLMQNSTANRNLSGEILRGLMDRKSGCDFDPDTMEE
jgi:hypothetical protein